jgi:homoserine kinase
MLLGTRPTGGHGDRRGRASIEAEGEGALIGKGRVKTCRCKSYARNLEEPKLTWDVEPSSGLGSEAPVVVAAAVAVPAAVAAAAPAVTAVGLT